MPLFDDIPEIDAVIREAGRAIDGTTHGSSPLDAIRSTAFGAPLQEETALDSSIVAKHVPGMTIRTLTSEEQVAHSAAFGPPLKDETALDNLIAAKHFPHVTMKAAPLTPEEEWIQYQGELDAFKRAGYRQDILGRPWTDTRSISWGAPEKLV
jgi:hypothetical protein